MDYTGWAPERIYRPRFKKKDKKKVTPEAEKIAAILFAEIAMVAITSLVISI